jgi:oxygen-independent coproporphyrinogen-3 oxidase
MLNALRLNEGFSVEDFCCRTGLADADIAARLLAAQRRGLLEPAAAGWRPTALGRRFLNDLQSAFLA